MLYQILAVFLLSILHLPTSSGKCRQTYATICDSFADLNDFMDKERVTDLIIGADNGTENDLKEVFIMEVINLEQWPQLISLSILGTYKSPSDENSNCLYTNGTLKYIKYYANDIKQIRRDFFPTITVNRLSLIDNKIEIITPDIFTDYQIEEIDASRNLLISLAKNTFHDATQRLILENNRIIHLEIGSLPKFLKMLRLRQNSLRNLDADLLNSVKNLEELDVSHNKLVSMPRIRRLVKLIIFDISYNQISFVDDTEFSQMRNLKYLDISYNKLKTLRLSNIVPNQPNLVLNLALNQLAELNLSSNLYLQKQKFVLYGNPWNCTTYDKMRKLLLGHDSECELEFLSNGKVPFCFDYGTQEQSFTNEEFLETIQRFQNIVQKQMKTSSCNLKPKRYQYLYNVRSTCAPAPFLPDLELF